MGKKESATSTQVFQVNRAQRAVTFGGKEHEFKGDGAGGWSVVEIG